MIEIEKKFRKTKVHYKKAIGLLLTIDGTKPTEELWNGVKGKVVEEIKSRIGDKPYDFFLKVSTPCDSSILFETPEDIMNLPIKDIPCPCGDKGHYLVKYEVYDDKVD